MPSYTSAPEQETYFVEPGEYQVEITEAALAISQNNNEMIKAKCRVLLPDGTKGPLLTEYLTFTEKAAFKIDQFRKAMGQTVTPGETATLEPEDILGKTLLAQIDEEPGSKNPDARFNTIKRWIPAAKPAPAKPTAPTIQKDADGDDIPF
jgi:hypothetical protein